MAYPRVFISSTFYNFVQIRSDLERFIREMGYEPILNEYGSIPYGSDERLEEYVYKELEHIDILISIIGGRFGSESQYQPYSISQKELKKAIELGKQVYIFIDKSVFAEYGTYSNNKHLEQVKYNFVDNIKVYEFIEEIIKLPVNNQIAPFETSRDITDYLKKQWAGLFQRFLQEQTRIKEIQAREEIQETAKTLKQLVTYLTEDRKNNDQAMKDILLSNHPIFQQLRTALNVPYRIFFTNHKEMEAWLDVRGYPNSSKSIDMLGDDTYETWQCTNEKEFYLLRIHKNVFDSNGKVKIYTEDEWDKNWIILEDLSQPDNYNFISEDEIPF